MGHIMWYTPKVGPTMENAAIELAIYMCHPELDRWKALEFLIGYLIGKGAKGTTVINPKVLKEVILCDSSYATSKETINSARCLVCTLVGTLLACYLKTQRTIRLSSTEADYVALLACAREVKFVNMLLQEIPEVKKPAILHEDNQGDIFLEKNRQVGMRTKQINIQYHFLKEMVQEKDTSIK